LDRPLSLIEELLLAILAADEVRRREGLRVLRGDPVPEEEATPVTGPILMPMGKAAQYMGVSRVTLWRMIKEGRLEQVELRQGNYRVRKADIDRLFGRRMPKPKM
jgi:excisionase family DNA binding protein